MKSLRKLSLSNAPKGFYFVAADNKAYRADSPKEMFAWLKKKKDELTQQTPLL